MGLFEKGQVANPNGNNGKPFRDALRMELAAAGEDHKELRQIAKNLIAIAKLQEAAALPAIREVADRTDGKVPQGTGQDPELGPIQTVTEVRTTIVDPRNPEGAGVHPAPEPGTI